MNSSTNLLSLAAASDTVAPPQTHRLSTSCDRHPDEHFSGFCTSCLCERLSVLDQNNNNNDDVKSSSRKPPTISTATLKALFKNGNSNVSTGNGRLRPSFLPELRRSKSFSASKNNEGLFSGVFEPQRRSCEVKLRSSLSNLFSQDEQRNVVTREATVSGGKTEEEPRKSSVREEPVLEVSEEEAESEEDQENGGYFDEVVSDSGEIVEEEEENVIREEEMKPMKDYMDLDTQLKKTPVRDLAGSFWSAASVFSKKLQKWKQKQKQKQKLKKRTGGAGGGRPPLPVEKSNGRQLRDTQSEIADYGFGRRSSDTDPRFSLDAGRFSVDIGRVSVDNARYSFDEPRASWDGYLFGRTALPQARIPPPPSMLTVVENAPVHRSDMQMQMDDPPPPSINPTNSESDLIIMNPGGSTQTRDYYTGPPSRRRKSLDRSNSTRKTATATVVKAENDEVKPVSNLKVSTPVTIDSNNSMEAVENNRILGEDAASGEVKVNQNGNKKSKRWGKWSILGFIYRKGGVSKSGDDDDEEDRNSRSNSAGVVERSLSEPWSELRNGGGGRMVRSNSSKSWRSSGSGSARKVVNGGGLETNRSWRYSPKDRENGMLRFYLTPMRSSWRRGGSSGGNGGGGGGGGWEKTAARANSHGHSIARNVMRLY